MFIEGSLTYGLRKEIHRPVSGVWSVPTLTRSILPETKLFLPNLKWSAVFNYRFRVPSHGLERFGGATFPLCFYPPCLREGTIKPTKKNKPLPRKEAIWRDPHGMEQNLHVSIHQGSKMPGGMANEVSPPIQPMVRGMEKIFLECTVSIRPHSSHEKEPHPWIDTIYRLVGRTPPRIPFVRRLS
ncbi:uncharacterized protein CDAR_586401 [Caerostris darwini]|uniref:Uncharacterized protein n=1 Tax=Caerostris darwini TaxID=1538125 RepID=A0AAV4Q7B4_9ARAC|nr:uncharacterized protein CDAR_586401 [Caerostris darwini]